MDNECGRSPIVDPDRDPLRTSLSGQSIARDMHQLPALQRRSSEWIMSAIEIPNVNSTGNAPTPRTPEEIKRMDSLCRVRNAHQPFGADDWDGAENV